MSYPPGILGDMNDQLVLLDDENDPGGSGEGRPGWQLDEQTREIGRRGVALARQALRQAAARAA